VIKRIISFFYRILFNFIASIFPVKKQMVIFESFNGKIPSDNPLAIYQEMIQSTDFADWTFYWSIKKESLSEAKEKYPEIFFISRFSFKWLLLMPRAGFWIFNSRLSEWLKKNKQTIYLQTWHGTPLKKLGADIDNVVMPNTDTQKYKAGFYKESNRWDYLIAPNEYSKNIFKTAFGFENTFLDIGYPRNDVLVRFKDDDNTISQLKKKIIGDRKGHVLLYAPTWRDDYFISKGNYKFFMPFELSQLTSRMNKDDTLIIRPHYLVKESIVIDGYEDQIKICSDEDINELYLISDCLITDYSSVMFDYLILKKPLIFYPYDLNHYENGIRGFYFDYSEVPGSICLDEQSFYQVIEKFCRQTIDSECSDTKYLEFYNKFCSWENGDAANKVAELIKECNIRG
jgi:CDP-glycerol glycerophosphotransferase